MVNELKAEDFLVKIFKFLYPLLNRLSILSPTKSFIGPEMMQCAPSDWMEVITVLSPSSLMFTLMISPIGLG